LWCASLTSFAQSRHHQQLLGCGQRVGCTVVGQETSRKNPADDPADSFVSSRD
jgi:hypothetical protein